MAQSLLSSASTNENHLKRQYSLDFNNQSLTIERCFIFWVRITLRSLVLFIASQLFITACSTTSQSQHDDKVLSNEDTVSASVEIQPNANNDFELSCNAEAECRTDATSNLTTSSESNQQNSSAVNAFEQHDPENQSRPDAGNSSAGEFILNNEPTKQVIKSIESVTDTFNIITFGIFATGLR